MNTADLIYVVLIMCVASYIQSSTGFGLALVCLSVLPMILTVEDSISLITVFNLAITGLILIFNRSGVSFKKAMPLVIGGMIGLPIGYLGLKAMDGSMIIRVLGVLLVLISLNELLKGRILPHVDIPEKAGVPIGILAGLLGGAFNVGGPPIVIFAYSQKWGKTQSVAVMQTVFLAMGFFRIGLMIRSGDCRLELVRMGLYSILPALVAVWLGKKTLDRFPLEKLKTIVFTMILGVGILYTIRG